MKQPVLEIAVKLFLDPGLLLLGGRSVFFLGNLIPVFTCRDYVCLYRFLVLLVFWERLIKISFVDPFAGGFDP